MPPKDPPHVDGQAVREHSIEERRQASLRELSAEWERKLKCLNDPDAQDRSEAIFAAGGRTKVRPKAGESF